MQAAKEGDGEGKRYVGGTGCSDEFVDGWGILTLAHKDGEA